MIQLSKNFLKRFVDLLTVHLKLPVLFFLLSLISLLGIVFFSMHLWNRERGQYLEQKKTFSSKQLSETKSLSQFELKALGLAEFSANNIAKGRLWENMADNKNRVIYYLNNFSQNGQNGFVESVLLKGSHKLLAFGGEQEKIINTQIDQRNSFNSRQSDLIRIELKYKKIIEKYANRNILLIKEDKIIHIFQQFSGSDSNPSSYYIIHTFDYSKFNNYFTKAIRFLPLLALLLALILSWIFHILFKDEFKPLTYIARIYSELGKGNFHVFLKYKKNDEIGHLVQSLNHVAQELGAYFDKEIEKTKEQIHKENLLELHRALFTGINGNSPIYDCSVFPAKSSHIEDDFYSLTHCNEGTIGIIAGSRDNSFQNQITKHRIKSIIDVSSKCSTNESIIIDTAKKIQQNHPTDFQLNLYTLDKSGTFKYLACQNLAPIYINTNREIKILDVEYHSFPSGKIEHKYIHNLQMQKGSFIVLFADSLGNYLNNFDMAFYRENIVNKALENLEKKSIKLSSRNLLKEIVYTLFLYVKNNTNISANPLQITGVVIYYP